MAKYVAVNVSNNGDHVVIPGVTGKIITIFALNLVANALTTYNLKMGTNAVSGPMTYATGGSCEMPISDSNWYFQGAPGEGFNINISSLLGSVGGFIIFNQDDA